MTVEQRLEAIEADLAIRRLIAEYAHGTDRRDLERFKAIWHDDAVFHLGEPLGSVRGRDAIGETARTQMWPNSRFTHHWTVNVSIQVDGATATSMANAFASVMDAAGNRFAVSVTYDDEFERRDGVWGFTSRAFTIHERDPLTAPMA
jgi:hypothetical protein